MAADDDEAVAQLGERPHEPDRDLGAGLKALHALGDLQHRVRAHEGTHHARAAAERRGRELAADLAQADPDKLAVLEPGDKAAAQPGPGLLRLAAGSDAGVEPQQRAHQLLEHDDARDGVARDAEDGLPASQSEYSGLAGLDGEAVTEHLAHARDGGGAQVLAPGGGAGAEYYGVALVKRGLQRGVYRLRVVADDGVAAGQSAQAAEHGREDGGVELHDVAGAGVGAGLHQLVARGDDADNGAAADLALEHAGRKHGAHGGWADLRPRGEDHLACADVLADLAHVLPGRGRGAQADAAVRQGLDVLGHDDGVAALGQGVAGVHGDVLPRRELNRRRLRRAEGEGGRERHAVHGAGVIVRRADLGVHRAIAHAAAGVHGAHRLRLGG